MDRPCDDGEGPRRPEPGASSPEGDAENDAPPERCRLAGVKSLALAAVCGSLVAVLNGCATSPADQEATRKAWADRDAERAAECRRNGLGGYANGGCLGRGGP